MNLIPMLYNNLNVLYDTVGNQAYSYESGNGSISLVNNLGDYYIYV